MKKNKVKKEEKKDEKIQVTLARGEEDISAIEKCVEFVLSMRGQLIVGQALANSIKAMENREPEMWRESANISDMKYILKNFGMAKVLTDMTNKDTKYFVMKNKKVVVEYDDAIYNGKMAVDTSNYYSASVQVTFSPVLIDGGSKEPQEIGLWSSDSVATDDEFNFEGA